MDYNKIIRNVSWVAKQPYTSDCHNKQNSKQLEAALQPLQLLLILAPKHRQKSGKPCDE